MIHTDGCKDAMRRYEKEVKEFETKWPNYCRKCGGWGGFYVNYDPSSRGTSLGRGYMTDFDLCLECLEKDLCPRCGKTIITIESDYSDTFKCDFCGFEEGKTSGLPEEPECFCYMELEDY